MTTSNPYSPPKDEGYVVPPVPRTEGVVMCTFMQNEDDLASGLLLTAKARRFLLPLYGAFIGFVLVSVAGVVVSVVVAVVLAAAGWFFAPKLFSSNAKRAIANKSEAERTLTWRFSADGYEVTTLHSYSRADWSTIHRVIDGPKSFVIYVSEAVVHVIPKRALYPDDVPVLALMLASRVTPRKKPKFVARAIVLWLVLIVMFLAVWQFLQTDR